MGKPRLLLADDESAIRKVLESAFDKAGYEVTVASSGLEALQHFLADPFDVVLTDVTMPGMTGFELMQELRSRGSAAPVVIMTAHGTIPQAIQAIRDGAHEYVTKPFDLGHLKKVVAAAHRPVAGARRSKSVPAEAAGIIAKDPKMQDVLSLVDQVADSRATVMIGGESGVGKEVIAKTLHDRSSRARGPFVAVSCAALPETLVESELFGYEKGAFTGANGARVGKFEAANGGTLFLDEIGEIPLHVQVKLLRALQERQIERLGANSSIPLDVRLVTATHRDLHAAVEAGTFRLDLLYRLQVVEITIPALRERPDDILPLARHFLLKYAAENSRDPLEMSAEAEEALLTYRWPGNVRELENAIERAVVLAAPGERHLAARLLPGRVQRAA